MTISEYYGLDCQLGWRKYTERFRSPENARVFVETMLTERNGKKTKYRWKSATKITALDADTLMIECPHLEKIMETTGKGKLHESTREKIATFLYGTWDQVGGDPAKPKRAVRVVDEDTTDSRVKTPKPSPSNGGVGDVVTLAALCEQNKWDPRVARRVLRSAGTERSSGRWEWDKAAAAEVEKVLRQKF